MPEGPFVVGRSSQCSLALDDGLVSRRHAILHVGPEGVELEDLGSRNGVMLNGNQVLERKPLRHLDRITIGAQEMVFIEVAQQNKRANATKEFTRCPQCATFVDGSASHCTQCGTPLRVDNRTLEIQLDPQKTLASESTEQASAFRLISGIAQKALQLNKHADAQRMLEPHFRSLLEQLREGGELEGETLQQATAFALAVSEGLGTTGEIDWILEASRLARVLLETAEIERLHRLVRKTRYRGLSLFRAYLETIRRDAGSYSASQRFRLKRLEGLERVIAA